MSDPRHRPKQQKTLHHYLTGGSSSTAAAAAAGSFAAGSPAPGATTHPQGFTGPPPTRIGSKQQPAAATHGTPSPCGASDAPSARKRECNRMNTRVAAVILALGPSHLTSEPLLSAAGVHRGPGGVSDCIAGQRNVHSTKRAIQGIGFALLDYLLSVGCEGSSEQAAQTTVKGFIDALRRGTALDVFRRLNVQVTALQERLPPRLLLGPNSLTSEEYAEICRTLLSALHDYAALPSDDARKAQEATAKSHMLADPAGTFCPATRSLPPLLPRATIASAAALPFCRLLCCAARRCRFVRR